MTTVNFRAFRNCDALASISFPAALTTLEAEVFRDTASILSVNYAGNAPTSVNAAVYS